MGWLSLWCPLVPAAGLEGRLPRPSVHPELMLETCAPESINADTFCPSTMTGASLNHPTRWTMGSRLRKGTAGLTCHALVHQAICMLASLGPGSGWECEGPIAGLGNCYWWGWATFLQFPPGWFKAEAGVGYSLAIWPQSWHLKHWREVRSQQQAGPSLLVLDPCARFWGQISGWGYLARTTATAVRVWGTRGAPPTTSQSMVMLTGSSWCTGVATALSGLGSGQPLI